MAGLRVVVLGAGFGGLEVATRLSQRAPDEVEVTLIDKGDAFVFGFSKLDVMLGRSPLDAVRLPYAAIDKPSVTFRQETVLAIDPDSRVVTTDAGRYPADVLVIGLGADLDPAGTPGLVEGGHEFYSVAGSHRLASVLPSFDRGHVVVGVMGAPYKCPPAPSEAALMLHDHLEAAGRRSGVRISVVTPLPSPVPPSPATSAALLEAFAERDIGFHPATTVTSLDPAGRTCALSTGEELPYDLFLGVPLHRVPQVLVDSGLAEPGGWVQVEPTTLATRWPGVYALGDVANAPVPRAGVFAERAAAVVVDGILAQLRGGEVTPYDGFGTCWVEFGAGRVGRVEVTFLSAQGITAAPFEPPTVELARHKEEFGSTRRRRWFGL